MKNPNPNMLLRIAQADAYCTATEYIDPVKYKDIYDEAKQFKGFIKHPKYTMGAGRYTDDTQMSIAVAEQLLSGDEISKLSFADHFMRAFLRDKRDAYSRGFQKLLEECSNGQELLGKITPTSTRNGAAMRSIPLGVISDVSVLLDVARLQASVTHDTLDGIISSQSIAFLSWWALHTDASFDIACKKLVGACPKFRQIYEEPWQGRVKDMRRDGGFDVGLNTVWAVTTLLKEQKTLMGILDQVIDWGGDTDSVAAIAWGIASTRMRDQVPEFMELDLEAESRYGVQFLKELGSRLMEKYDI